MTHYRLSLTRGRGPTIRVIAEKHSFSASIPTGWWNAVNTIPPRTIHISMCGMLDRSCEKLMRSEDAGTSSSPDGPTTPTPGAK